MHLDEDFRKEVWNEYCELEILLKDIRYIVQNDIPLYEDDLDLHKELTARLVSNVDRLHNKINNAVCSNIGR